MPATVLVVDWGRGREFEATFDPIFLETSFPEAAFSFLETGILEAAFDLSIDHPMLPSQTRCG
jgi:hypothetical protein